MGSLYRGNCLASRKLLHSSTCTPVTWLAFAVMSHNENVFSFPTHNIWNLKTSRRCWAFYTNIWIRVYYAMTCVLCFISLLHLLISPCTDLWKHNIKHISTELRHLWFFLDYCVSVKECLRILNVLRVLIAMYRQ